MIREHTFNSEWWGQPVGIVSDPAFFSLGAADQQQQLESYAWVEFVAPLDTVSPQALAAAGFLQTDTQITFKLNLSAIAPLPGFTNLRVEFASESPFAVDAASLAPFSHERFRYLPGITDEKLTERYALWAKALIGSQPDWCLRVRDEAQVQGWFLSERHPDGFHLTLAALHREASISGMLLYHQAMLAYAERGQRIGRAGFSVTNAAVHNIYARLQARFLPPTGCWLWTASR